MVIILEIQLHFIQESDIVKKKHYMKNTKKPRSRPRETLVPMMKEHLQNHSSDPPFFKRGES